MRSRGLGLKGKFMVALLASAALPFVVALVIFETSSYRHFLDQRGKIHQIQAGQLARTLAQASESHAGILQAWLVADPALREWLDARNNEVAHVQPAELARQIDRVDQIWLSLPDDEPRILEILDNPGSDSLRSFTRMHPGVAEILVTDASGRLVAATARASDYNQADEEWWWEGSALSHQGCWSDMPQFDASSGVYSIDVAFPLRNDDELAGVVKLSADISSMFTRLGASLDDGGTWRIVLADGKVLASSTPDFIPLGESVTPRTLEYLRSGKEGWFLEQNAAGQAWMTGAVALKAIGQMHSAYVLFSSPRDEAVAPLQQRFLQIGTLAVVMLTVCTLIGFGILQRHLLQPIATLSRASRALTERTLMRLPGSHGDPEAPGKYQSAVESLSRIEAIRTGDEIEKLAADFAELGATVMRYQEEVETRLATEKQVSPGTPADDLTSPVDRRES